MVNDGTVLNVTDVVTATAGDIVLNAAGTGNAIAVQAGGSLIAVSTGTVSARADLISVDPAGTITGGVFEYATDSLVALQVGGVGGQIADLTGVGASLVRLGEARGSITATGITLGANLSLSVGRGSATALDLESTKSISDGGFELLNVTTLSGVANTGSVTLGSLSNTVTNIGTFTVSAGGFTLGDGTDLTVAGLLTAGGPVSLKASSITIPGSITTGGSTTGSVSLVTNATTIAGTGSITTGTLTGSASTAIDLTGSNQIGNLGSLSGTVINLNDGTALTISNTVSASGGGVTLTSGGLLTVASGQTVIGAGVTLSGTALAISGQVTTAGTVDLIASTATGGITETGTIDALALIGSVGASAILSGASVSANQINNLGSFTATTGTISLNDGMALNVSGIVSATSGDVVLRSTGLLGVGVLTTGALELASSGTVSVRASAFSVAGAGTVTGGVFEYALDTPGLMSVGLLGQIVDLTGVGSSLVRLGSAQGSITAQGLLLTSDLDLGVGNGGAARALDLESHARDRRGPVRVAARDHVVRGGEGGLGRPGQRQHGRGARLLRGWRRLHVPDGR